MPCSWLFPGDEMARKYPETGRPLRRSLACIARNTTRSCEKAIGFDLAFNEETVTDLFLFELKKALGGAVTVVKMKRHEEARTGADWVWWFGDTSGWFGMRVQAKKMDPQSQTYLYLDHRTRKHGR